MFPFSAEIAHALNTIVSSLHGPTPRYLTPNGQIISFTDDPAISPIVGAWLMDTKGVLTLYDEYEQVVCVVTVPL